MSAAIDQIQDRLRATSVNAALWCLRLFSGLFWGAALALAFEVILEIGRFSFWFVAVAVSLSVIRLIKNWGWVGVTIFNLGSVLAILLFRMYVLMAANQ
ncbi:MAG: hypothetical protein COT74_11490 [Bdellovibrionales bacterium CG10_big_fil_rev_8_21_14_0_10_45_34]|nr:MAG: hypothetical protein COT74_11490 [Bdellovibrionales bacterium CG10_big_fil_rev_8_21_14_0_10_45_34]